MRNYYSKKHFNPLIIKKTRDDINYDLLEDLQSSCGWFQKFTSIAGQKFTITQLTKFTFKIKIQKLNIDLVAEKVTTWRSQWSWKINGEKFDATNGHQVNDFLSKYFDVMTQAKYWKNSYDPTAQFSDDYRYVSAADLCLRKLEELKVKYPAYKQEIIKLKFKN